jgi:hypothetical protein
MFVRLVQQPRNCQRERRDHGIEAEAVVGLHAIKPLHSADRRLKDRTTRVNLFFTGIEVRLLTDDTVAVHFLHLAVGIRNDPVSANQLCRDVTAVADRDGVRKHVTIGVRFGLIVDVARRYLNLDIAFRFLHGAILTYGTRQMVTEFNVFLDTDLFRAQPRVNTDGDEVRRLDVILQRIANGLATFHERVRHNR